MKTTAIVQKNAYHTPAAFTATQVWRLATEKRLAGLPPQPGPTSWCFGRPGPHRPAKSRGSVPRQTSSPHLVYSMAGGVDTNHSQRKSPNAQWGHTGRGRDPGEGPGALLAPDLRSEHFRFQRRRYSLRWNRWLADRFFFAALSEDLRLCYYQARSKRSRFMTLFHTATKVMQEFFSERPHIRRLPLRPGEGSFEPKIRSTRVAVHFSSPVLRSRPSNMSLGVRYRLPLRAHIEQVSRRSHWSEPPAAS